MFKRLFKTLFPVWGEETEPHAAEISAQAVDILYNSLFRIGLVLLLMPLIMLWVMWGNVPSLRLLIWAAFAIGYIVVGLVVVKAYLRRRRPVSEAPRWGRYFTYLSFATGLVWGCAALLFLVPGSVALQVFLLVVIVAISVRTIALHAYWIESYYALIAPLFLCEGLTMVLAHDKAYTGLLFAFVPAIVVLVHVAQNASRDVRASIRLRFENLELVDQLRAEKDKAVMANRDKTRFLASASHDLRQPVQAMTMFTHALRQSIQNDGKATALLDHVSRSIDALDQLLVSLLDISRLDADIVKPNLEHFDLQRLVTALRNEYAPQAQAKNVALRVNSPADVVVYSDRVLLETMLRNLVSNALRYTACGTIDLQVERDGTEIRVAVRDTGVGIAPDQFDAIFQEFYQISNPERDRSKGLGLGLAIVKRLAALLHHRIELESTLGQGSCFTLVVPPGDRNAMLQAEALQPFLGQRDIDGMRVLVIDDEQAVREGLNAVLEGWGCITILAGSGEEALRILQRQAPPHAIISDYRLRDGKTGAQAIENLRAWFEETIPALIITGDTDPERMREAQASGNALLHKPAHPAKLRAWLRSVQRRK